ncbi:MAG: glycosyltransferase [Varibaculum sp.]
MIQQRNAIDTSAYRYDAAIATQVREEFGVTDSGTFVLGHVGRFFPQKNHTFLIDIFAEVHKRHPNSVLWLVGGGELNDALKTKLKPRLTISACLMPWSSWRARRCKPTVARYGFLLSCQACMRACR